MEINYTNLVLAIICTVISISSVIRIYRSTQKKILEDEHRWEDVKALRVPPPTPGQTMVMGIDTANPGADRTVRAIIMPHYCEYCGSFAEGGRRNCGKCGAPIQERPMYLIED